MQNREELRQKGHDGSLKTMCLEKGKKSFSEGGGDKYHQGLIVTEQISAGYQAPVGLSEPSDHTYFFIRCIKFRGTTLKLKYLRKIETEFEKNRGYDIGVLMGSVHEKKKR
jgi:hypothetical protein